MANGPDMLRRFWKFLSAEKNQRTLGFVGTGVGAFIAAAWAAFVYIYPAERSVAKSAQAITIIVQGPILLGLPSAAEQIQSQSKEATQGKTAHDPRTHDGRLPMDKPQLSPKAQDQLVNQILNQQLIELNRRGVELMQLERYEEAYSVFQSALSLRPKSHAFDENYLVIVSQLLANCGSALVAMKRFDDAEVLVRESIQLIQSNNNSPSDLAVQSNTLGLIYLNTGRYEDARVEFIRARALVERDPKASATVTANLSLAQPPLTATP